MIKSNKNDKDKNIRTVLSKGDRFSLGIDIFTSNIYYKYQSINAISNLIFPQINVKTTYVNDLINCEMYMKQLEGFSNCCIMHL